jgi:hypothetical protein
MPKLHIKGVVVILLCSSKIAFAQDDAVAPQATSPLPSSAPVVVKEPTPATVPAITTNVSAAPLEPDGEGATGLLSDVERIVNSVDQGGWFSDRRAYEEIMPTLLHSVCRATEGARRTAVLELEHRAARLGDPRAIFKHNGHQVDDRFEAALTAERERDALRRALELAPSECPFWIEPRAGFRGRQTDRKRFSLSLETGGNIQLRQTAGRWTFGGGGLGRILPGYGFADHWSVLAGVEFGGGAMLRPGGEQTEFVVNYFPAIPVILRYRDVSWHYDLEVGGVGLFQADDVSLSPGARIGTSIGVFALRTRNLLPWAGIAATYEYYFESGGRPAAHFLRGGLRVGVVWDGL